MRPRFRSSNLVPAGFVVDHLDVGADRTDLIVRSGAAVTIRPDCRTPSRRIQSRYQRRAADLPLGGRRGEFQVRPALRRAAPRGAGSALFLRRRGVARAFQLGHALVDGGAAGGMRSARSKGGAKRPAERPAMRPGRGPEQQAVRFDHQLPAALRSVPCTHRGRTAVEEVQPRRVALGAGSCASAAQIRSVSSRVSQTVDVPKPCCSARSISRERRAARAVRRAAGAEAVKGWDSTRLIHRNRLTDAESRRRRAQAENAASHRPARPTETRVGEDPARQGRPDHRGAADRGERLAAAAGGPPGRS